MTTVRTTTSPGGLRWLPRALFFASGAVTLAEEVLWMRRFTELLGATAATAAATLLGVFAGFAASSFAAARFAARVRRPLRSYGLLELAAALAALALLPMASGAEALVPALRRALAETPTVARAVETLLAAAMVLLPTACLGATLPVVAPALGGGGGRAWLCDRGPRPAPSATTPPPAREIRVAAAPLREASACALSFVSGMTLLALEAACTRLFAQVHESSLHAFAVVVAAFLFALALGTLIAKGLLRFGLDPRLALGGAWLAAALVTAAAPLVFSSLTGGLSTLTGSSSERFVALLRLAAIVLVPPIALGGAALPLLLGPAGGAPDPRQLGRVLGWNTLGSIVGPLLATFVAFPSIGLHSTFFAAGALLLLTTAVVLVPRVTPGRRAPLCVALAVVAALQVCFAAHAPARVRLDPAIDEELVELTEGPLAIAAVTRSHGDACIKLDNHYVLGGTKAAGDQRQLGHLPLLLHPAPPTSA